jgi:hypothetical protein
MNEELTLKILREIAEPGSGAIFSRREAARSAADLIEQQAARLTALESERDALLAAAGKEEVAWMTPSDWRTEPLATCDKSVASAWRADNRQVTPLYTAPAAALEKGDGRDAWQPIETAPKDGTPLILFARAKHATASAPVIGWWLPDMGWIESAYAPNHPVGIVPSHWMPRPKFPAALSQKAGEQQ